MKLDEEQLVAQCRKNNQRACRELYDRYASIMFSICVRYMGDHDAAQDVLHDGFVKIFASLGQLRSSDSLQAWMTRIMVRESLDALRKVKPTESLELIGHADYADNEFESIIEGCDIELLFKAIRELPEFSRIIFNLHEIEGYSYDELSERFDIKAVTIRSIIFRARKLIADRLA